MNTLLLVPCADCLILSQISVISFRAVSAPILKSEPAQRKDTDTDTDSATVTVIAAIYTDAYSVIVIDNDTTIL